MILSPLLLIIGWFFLIPAVIAETLDSITEFAIPTKYVKEETETHPVSKKAKIGKCSINII